MFFNQPVICPKNQNPIIVDWITIGGGMRVYAYTNDSGEPTLAIATFDENWRMTSRMKIVEYSSYQDIMKHRCGSRVYDVPFVALVTAKELMLIVRPPLELDQTHNVTRTKWGTPHNGHPLDFDTPLPSTISAIPVVACQP